MKDVLENHLKDQSFRFGSLVELSPYTCEGPVENPTIWKESLTWIVPRIRSVRRGNLEG